MNFQLKAQDIDRASEEIRKYLEAQGIEQARITRLRLGAEDSLLRFMEQFGEIPFSLKMGKLLGKITVSISVKG